MHASDQERMKILELIAKQQLSSEEGLTRIKALRRSPGGELDRPTGTAGSHSRDQEILYGRSYWETVPACHPVSAKPVGGLVLFTDDDAWADSLRSLIGDRMVQVKAGDRYRKLGADLFEINPAAPDDYQALLRELEQQQRTPRHIIHGWSIDSYSSEADALHSQLEHGLYSMYHLCRTLLEQKNKRPIQLLYVYSAAANPLNPGSLLQPQYAAVNGFAKTLCRENPQFAVKTIGWDTRSMPSLTPESLAECLERELAEAIAGTAEVRYEHGLRQMKRYAEATMGSEESLPPFQDRGVYLITGGMGGLGSLFANYLAREFQARLILAGRSEIQEQGSRLLQELEALGAEAIYVRANLAKRTDVEHLISQAKARFGQIQGVIHSAGVLKDSYLLKKDRADMEAVLAPKVFGTVYLDEMTRTEPLDFFALFSSLAGVFGNVGQSDYAYANQFLDEFAGWRSAMRRPGKTVSINWPYWQDGRMAADEASFRQLSETTGLAALSTEAGIKAFGTALHSDMTQVMVLPGHADKIRNWIKELNQETRTSTSVEPVEALNEGAKAPFRKKTETFLKELLARQTKLPVSKIDSRERFEKYGIDSGMIIRLNREMERHFGDLSKTLFFEYQNLHELVDYFVEHHQQQLLTLIGGDDRPSASPQQSSVSADPDKAKERPRSRFLDRESPRSQTETKETAPVRDLAIVGISGRYPEAKNLDEFWENLKAGRDCIVEIPSERWDYRRFYDPDKTKRGISYSKWGGFLDGFDQFDPLFFNISPIEAEHMDPQERLFMETVWHTLEDAGYTRAGLHKNVGVFVGVMYGQYQLFGAEEMQKGNMIANTSSYAAIANRISYYFDFQGPSIAVDTMCSSSLTAIHLACESILRGECSKAIAGGVNLTLHPMKHLQLSQGNFAASDGRCRSFGDDGDGYVPGEGVGAVLIKPLSEAIRDGDHIYAVIKGTSINHGGKTNGFTVPNPKAQAGLISRALKNAGVHPRTISCIEAHGTGTSLGDPIEITGLANAFRESTQDKQYCSIGSAKSNIGHLESAAGIAGLTKVILQMKNRQLVPSLHSERLNPHIHFPESPFYVQRELTGWNRPIIQEEGIEREYPRRAGISSFGAGGSNAHIILEEYSAPEVPAEWDTQPRVAVFSAKTSAALDNYLRSFKSWLKPFSDPARLDAGEMIPYRDFVYTLQVGREAMDERLAVVAAGYAELAEKLARFLETRQEQDGVYSGSLRAKSAPNLLLMEEEEGEAFVQALIQKGRADQLAKVWVSGAAVPWEMGYANERPRRISLPAYPFEEGRYWIPTVDAPRTGNFTSLHPLVDTNESTLERQWYRKILNPAEFYLRDHRISGDRILPGAVYLEMAVAAGHLAVQDRRVRIIQNVGWMSPIGVREETLPVSIRLFPEGDAVDFEISTDTDDRLGDLVHSSGRLYYAGPEEVMGPGSIRPETIQQRCPVVKAGAECYSAFQRIGFQYGPGFQAIQRLYLNENECLAQLEVADFLESEFSAYVLHPSLLDGAFQTVAGFAQLAGTDLNRLFLPYALDELVLFGPLPPKCFAYVTVSGDSVPQMPKYNIQLADETGEVLVQLKGFTLKAAAAALPVLDSSASRTVYYQQNWVPADLAVDPEHGPLGDTVIFASEETLAVALQERCGRRKDSSRVILVRPGGDDRKPEAGVYSMAMDDPQAYLKLFDELQAQHISLQNIIYRWSPEKFTAEESPIQAWLARSAYSLLYLTRALIERNPNRPIRLLYLYESPNGEIQPLDAALGAFMKTIRLEYPHLIYQTMEIRGAGRAAPGNNLLEGMAELACRELQSSRNIPAEVRYEAQSRFIHQLQAFQPEMEAQPFTGICREQGVYLITGGAGGLGFIFARYLSERYKAKLVLVGRSPLNAETEDKLRSLEKSGAEILYVAADISKQHDVIEAVRKAKARFSRIDGVIHSAGVLRDSLAFRKTAAEMDEVLAAKLYGTLHLHEATRGEKLDFFTLFSSTSAVSGNIGQVDYAYANSFMDYFAEYRTRENAPGITTAINWPLWENGGMRVNDDAKTLMRQAGLVPLRDNEGIRIFETGLSAGIPNLIVFAGEPNQINRFLNPEPVTTADFQSQPEGNSSAEQYRDEVEAYLKTILSREIKLPLHQIDSQAPFEQYGIDSVMVLNLSRAFESFFGSLSKTLFFEYKSVAELAGYFIKFHPEKVAKLGKKPAKSPEKAQLQEPVRERATRSRFIAASASLQDRTLNEPVVQDIAIIGVSGRYPMAADLNEFWENLKSGRDCITEIPRERWAFEDYFDPDKNARGKSYGKWGGFLDGIDRFDPLFFNISPREAAYIDPQERLFLETVWQTLEDAGYTRGQLAQDKVGVFVGVMYGHYQLLEGGSDGVSPGSSHASIANRVSYYCNFRGPSIALDTMCSSSLTAIHLACTSIRNGESEVAIAGGVNLSVHPNKYLQLSQGKFLASDGRCRSFGAGGDGYVPGEGVGAVLLKPLHRAVADGDRIYAVIKASAVNHGGKTNGYTVPNPTAQAELIANTLKKARVDPRTVSYIEAHGTGTSLGDPIEITGLVHAFQEGAGTGTGGEPYCAIGSAKSNIGHLESAAGIAGITKVLLQMKHKQLVPSLHSDSLNPHIPIEHTPFYVQRKLTPWENPHVMENGIAKRYPLRAGVSSFGAGGSNAHIILEEYTPPVRENFPDPSEFIFVFSAKNSDRLKAYARKMAEVLQSSDGKSRETPGDQDLLMRVQHDLVKRVADILRISEAEVAPTEFGEYGLDPIGLTDLANQLNEMYQLDIDAALFFDYPAFADLSRHLLQMNSAAIAHYYGNPEPQASMEAREPFNLADLAYTLQMGRESMEERLAIVASSREELADRLVAFIEGATDREDIYAGNVRDNRLNAHMLVSGREGQEFLRIIYDEHQYRKLAQLWISGIDIDWRPLYPEPIPARISLPGYPFARERYWVSAAEPKESKQLAVRLHPLIDRNESTVAGLCFKKEFTAAEPFVHDFRLDHRQVVPGIIHLEMARAAGSLINQPLRVEELTNVAWGPPIPLDEVREAEIGLYPAGDSMEWEIRTITHDGRTRISAQGELSYAAKSEAVPPAEPPIDRLQADGKGPLPAAEFYELMERHGMKYATGLQVVRECFVADGEVLARFQLPASSRGTMTELALHPAVLESIPQLILALEANAAGTAGQPKALLKAARVKLLQPLTETGYVHIHPSQPSSEEEREFDATVASADGRVLAVLQQVQLETVRLDAHSETLQAEHGERTAFFLEKSWRAAEPTETIPTTITGTIIILGNEETTALADRLCSPNPDACIYIQDGWGYEHQTGQTYGLNFREADQAVRLIQDILKQRADIAAIIDLSDLHSRPSGTGRLAMGKVALLQELIKAIIPKPLTILHATTGLQESHKIPSLDGAGMAGLVRMLGAEYQKVHSKTVDTDLPMDKTEEWAEVIQREMRCRDAEGEIRYRAGKRYVPYLKPVDPGIGSPRSLVLNPEQAIVITGGTRGIGLEIARHLVRRGARKLVLMGVQQLPIRSRWRQLAGSSDTEPGVAAKVKALLELEDAGASLELYTGSLVQQAELEVFFQEVRRRMGGIQGVIHCAGYMSQANPAFIHKTEQDMQRVFEPKMEGLEVLHEVFKNDSVQFFLLFSSVSGLIPALAAGVSDYATANAYQDYFAAYQHRQGYGYYKSVNWPVWTGTGMASDIAPLYSQLGFAPLSVSEGLALFDAVLQIPNPSQIMPGLTIAERFQPAGLLHSNQAMKARSKPADAPISKSQPHRSITGTISALKSLFAEELKIPEDQLAETADFADFGVDSILLAELVKKVEVRFERKLEPGVFLEYSTLASLGSYLERMQSQKTPPVVEAPQPAPKERTPFRLEFQSGWELQSRKNRVSRIGNTVAPESHKVAVIGIACHFPGAQDKDSFWDNLAKGRSGIREIPASRWDIGRYYSPDYQSGKSISKWGGFLDNIEYFDPEYFHISESEALHMDPLIRQFLEISVETIQDAGYTREELWNKKVGVFVGSRTGYFASRIPQMLKNSVTGTGQNFIAAYAAHFLNLKGPNMVVDTACSSSMTSIHLACQSLMLQESEMALAGGVDILLDENTYLVLSEGRALSPDGKCHTFDEKANGFVPGEGCGAVLLKRLDKALADGDHIYAVIEGSAINNDGRTMGVTTPNPEAQSMVIQEALTKAEATPGSISYIENHGTGTMIGDPIELKALTKVFRESTREKQFCAVGSVKTNLGHLLSAAGIASFIKVALSLYHRQLPPTLNCETPNPRFEFASSPFYPNTRLQEWKPRAGIRRAGISSFGFGGTNVHMIVSEAPNQEEGRKTRQPLPRVIFNRRRFWLDSIPEEKVERPIAADPLPNSAALLDITVEHSTADAFLKFLGDRGV
ncbi:SDR family NAD(P)-dependent oxidoreductase [Gorillibacterium sp. sgz500922]|uniref:SDR family NAD(P)-dependent oxidoreductase n=1 Tax=Gorillibacterium sp. sgz500922 TaxID=3446694 RepID=UPI003F67D5C4